MCGFLNRDKKEEPDEVEEEEVETPVIYSSDHLIVLEDAEESFEEISNAIRDGFRLSAYPNDNHVYYILTREPAKCP